MGAHVGSRLLQYVIKTFEDKDLLIVVTFYDYIEVNSRISH